MSLQVYSPDFSSRHEITHAISLQMSDYYNGIGKMTITLPLDDYNIRVLQNNSVLYDTAKKLAFVVQQITINAAGNTITANGYGTNQLLNRRVIRSKVVVTNVERGCYTAVQNNLRGLYRVSIGTEKGLSEETKITLYGNPVLDQIMPVLSDADLGHRMVWNYRTLEHVFEVYKGDDLTTGPHAVVFSDEQGTARNLIIDDDVSTLANVIYFAATYRSGDYEQELVEEVGNPEDSDRVEKWIAGNLTVDDGEGETSFRAKMRSQASLELAENIRRRSFSVTVDPQDMGTHYHIGDLVSCVSKRFGVKFDARISCVKYTADINGEKTEIILGTPKLIKIGEIKLHG